MLYDINLKIEYKYSYVAAGGRQILRLLPAYIPGKQNLVAGHINVEPSPYDRIEGRDFFDNVYTIISFKDPHDRIFFDMKARVEKFPDGFTMDVSPTIGQLRNDLLSVSDLSCRSPLHFAGPSERIVLAREFVDFAETRMAPSMSAREIVEAIGKSLHKDMSFDAEATDVHTKPIDAFRNRHGVCQDFSHVMISCLRGVGIPARYVSGYLRTIPPPGKPRLEGVDAMHAWVSAWCGADMGWIDYDPTNGVFAGVDHIVVATGRDYSDVAPVRGFSKLAGKQESKQTVDVVPLNG